MSKGKRSRKLLLIATALTIAALISVMYAYAVQIGQYTGEEVTVGGVGTGTVEYSTTNSPDPLTWASTLQVSTVSTSWYASLEIAEGNTYSGPVSISWQLQNETGSGEWSAVGSAVMTGVTLSTGSQTVYASGTGVLTGNTDWSAVIASAASGAGTYRVIATVNSV
jgi:hypothetical protein